VDSNGDSNGDSKVDNDGDGYSKEDGDCDDNDPNRFPGNLEVCDGIDNNCDGLLLDTEYDSDSDGYRLCDPTPDCDDSDATVYPGATEICDEKDNNCSGYIDEGCVSIVTVLPYSVKANDYFEVLDCDEDEMSSPATEIPFSYMVDGDINTGVVIQGKSWHNHPYPDVNSERSGLTYFYFNYSDYSINVELISSLTINISVGANRFRTLVFYIYVDEGFKRVFQVRTTTEDAPAGEIKSLSITFTPTGFEIDGEYYDYYIYRNYVNLSEVLYFEPYFTFAISGPYSNGCHVYQIDSDRFPDESYYPEIYINEVNIEITVTR
jgi:hypothetical protein